MGCLGRVSRQLERSLGGEELAAFVSVMITGGFVVLGQFPAFFRAGMVRF
jgi:hypothetical protein